MNYLIVSYQLKVDFISAKRGEVMGQTVALWAEGVFTEHGGTWCAEHVGECPCKSVRLRRGSGAPMACARPTVWAWLRAVRTGRDVGLEAIENPAAAIVHHHEEGQKALDP